MRTIDADDLIQHTYSAVIDGVETDIIDVSDVDNAPTVELEITEKQAILLLINSGWLVNHDKELREKWERPQGEWSDSVFKHRTPNTCTTIHGFECSECHAFSHLKSKYCSDCGAFMENWI